MLVAGCAAAGRDRHAAAAAGPVDSIRVSRAVRDARTLLLHLEIDPPVGAHAAPAAVVLRYGTPAAGC